MMRARVAAPALAVLAAVALGGCGESRSGGARATTTPRTIPRPGPRTVVVSLTEYRLTPANPRVTAAGVITFEAVNDGATDHALAISAPLGRVRTRTLKPGDHATLRVKLPVGTFKWACPIANHERLGMTGRVRVG